MSVGERWVNVEEVALHVGVTKDTIYRWIDQHGFPAHKAGRLLRFKLSQVDEWVEDDKPNKNLGTPKHKELFK